MADAAEFYITAGLPVAKNSGQTPTDDGSVFMTAGLPPEVLTSEAGVVIFRRRIEGD